jgi:hypothetical protein
MKQNNFFSKIGRYLKERVRKFLVVLKRNPHFIPLTMLFIAFAVLSFNLTKISNTTATMNKSGMGLCAFISMLLSILSMVCMLNAFPKRKKPNVAMIIIMMVFFLVMIGADIYYLIRLVRGVTTDPDAITVTMKNYFIIEAQGALIAHIVTIALTAVFVALEPLMAKLLKMINTSIEVESNGEIAAIDISEEG